MNSRERILKSISHEEPDQIPFDLAGSTWTGITNTAYQNLRKHLGLNPAEPDWSDVLQQIVVPSEEILTELSVDTRGVFPLTSHNWDVYSKLKDMGNYFEYFDEWGFTHHFPKNGYWFSLVKHSRDKDDFDSETVIENFQWPYAGNKQRFAGMREKATQFRNQDKIVMTKGLCAGLLEMHQRVRGMKNAMLDPFLFPMNSDKLIGKLADLKIEFWDSLLDEMGDVVDIVGEGDDYGTQQSQLIAPEQFRQYYKPHFARVMNFIKGKAPNIKLLFHSCENVRPIIPDIIEMGVDLLNPVHIKASGMEPIQLKKKDFGKDIVFWGGGVDTQHVLPNGTPEQVKEDVKRNIEALASGGGFVFCTVHNIQAEVTPQNIMAMIEAFREIG